MSINRAEQAIQWIAECDTLTSRGGHNLAYRRRGSGPTIVLLHGYPTWSYDYASVAANLAADYNVVTLDFLGYGASDKPNPYAYSVSESADCVEDLFALLGVDSAHLVAHNFGGIVAQELLDRHHQEKLPFTITSVTMLNCGIVYRAYRPTLLQRVLNTPVLGQLVTQFVNAKSVRTGLNGVWGKTQLSECEFDNIWYGMALKDGHKLAYLLIGYNTERSVHYTRWEAALRAWNGPLQLIWGVDDPVSGKHVLDIAEQELTRAKVTRLEGVGHFPQNEAPIATAKTIREFIQEIGKV